MQCAQPSLKVLQSGDPTVSSCLSFGALDSAHRVQLVYTVYTVYTDDTFETKKGRYLLKQSNLADIYSHAYFANV